jgi:hypothetical protein
MFCTDLNKCQCAQCRIVSNGQPVARVPLPSSAPRPTETLFLPLRPTGRSRRTAAATVRRPRVSETTVPQRMRAARRTIPYARSRALRTMRWFGVSQLRTSALTESAGADAVGAAATSAPARASYAARAALRCYAVLRCILSAAAWMRMRDHSVKPTRQLHAARHGTARHGMAGRRPLAVRRDSTRRQL